MKRLAPAPIHDLHDDAEPEADIHHAASETGASPPLPATGNERRRTKTTNACDACQRRHLKCNGARPCESCLTAGIDCVFDPSKDGRRRGHVKTPDVQQELAVTKRKLQRAEQLAAKSQRLIDSLRNSSEEDAARIVNGLRDSENGITVIDSSANGAGGEGNVDPNADSPIAVHHQRPLRSRFVSSLCDAPHLNVHARPWTTVTADDELISHLVSLWFTWHTPHMLWIDQDLFVRDMLSGNPAAPFCSKFLVNILCAQACPYSQYPESCARPGDRSTSGLHFLDEAKKELDKEDGPVSLTTLQGLGVLYSFLCTTGKERQGWVYFGQLARAYAEYLAYPNDWPERNLPGTEKLQQTVDLAAWGLFNIMTTSTLSWQKAPEVQPPKRTRPHADHNSPQLLNWIPYPHQAPVATVHADCCMDAHCDASLILRDLNAVLFPSTPRAWNDGRLAAVEQHLSALHDWFRQLSPCLQLQPKQTPPCILTLHANYYATVIAVLRQIRSAVAANQVRSMRMPEHIAQDTVTAAFEIVKLISILDGTWGAERMSIRDSQAIILAMFALLEAKRTGEAQRAFASLCHFAQLASRMWFAAKAQLRLVQVSAKEMNAALPPGVEQMFEALERNMSHDDRSRYSSMQLSRTLSIQTTGDGSERRVADASLQGWGRRDEDE